MQDMQPQPTNPQVQTLDGGPDHEGALAKADLYKLANYSFKLFKKLEDDAQLEAWVQAKITKAADYIASVYHYIEYEMEFSDYGSKLDNSEVYSESQKRAIKNKLMEAKSKVAELKKLKAEKLKDKKKVDEGHIFGGHEETCSECGGTGMVQVPEREVPEAVKEKVRKYNRQAKAFHAASKRLDRNKNGIPDALENDEEVEEDQSSLKRTGDTFKTRTGVATKTSTGVRHTNTSHSDEEHGEPASNVKAKSAAEKKADKEKEIKLPKHKGNTWGMKSGEKFGNGAKPAKKKEEEEVEEGQGGKMGFGQGVYEGKSKKAKKDYDKDGKIESEKDEVIGSRRKAAGLDEAKKPSAGLTKKQKSATVKSAKAGKDIGKPGKNFDKVAKAAGGGEKGEKIAAAAMWKAKSKAAVKEAIARVKNEGSEPGMPSKINPNVDTREVFYVAAGSDGKPHLKVNDSGNVDSLPKIEHLPKLDTPGYDIASKGFRAINIELPGSKERVGAFMSGQYVYANKESYSKLQQAMSKGSLKESADLDRMKEFLTRLNG